MKRFTSMLAIAFLTAGFGATALAQYADKSKTTSTTKGVQQSQASKTQRHQGAAGEVRDWKAIDKNHDNLIEPEEMEAYLQQGKSKAKQ
jgi:hypothetical protein